MTRVVMTSAIVRALVTTVVAGGLAAGCSSSGKAIGQSDAQAPDLDAPAGSGGAAGSGSDAAIAGSGGGTESGGVTATAGSTRTGGATGSGGTTGVGGTTQTGGTTGAGGATSSGGATGSGGFSASGGSGGKGGAGGSGGTSSTGGPDASADKPPATWGMPCSSQDDCEPSTGMYFTCHYPGESPGCPPCRTGPSDCSTDGDCIRDGGSATGTMICELQTSGACYCPAAMFCVVGCRTNADCGSGQACNQGHSCENTCVAGDGTCPVNTSCATSGFCRRRSCASDSECSGFCVNGWCYQARGTCAPIPG
jgi:hypothetical protein